MIECDRLLARSVLRPLLVVSGERKDKEKDIEAMHGTWFKELPKIAYYVTAAHSLACLLQDPVCRSSLDYF